MTVKLVLMSGLHSDGLETLTHSQMIQGIEKMKVQIVIHFPFLVIGLP